MSKNVAIIGAAGEVVAINVQPDDHTPEAYEVIVTGSAWVGGDYVDGYFYPPRPFPSWLRDSGDWVPPVPMPQGATAFSHRWDESTLSWVEVTPES